ncbi:MAG: NCS2 family permease [Rhodocyclaceae bacterium]|nr:NCS2 family permease [Rhodocyclaceae bacterium]
MIDRSALYANYPIAIAPGMGLNAYFAFAVVGGMGFTWQQALGAVFISGVLFILVSLFRLREWIVNSIPRSLKFAISADIGLFLAIIGLKNAGLITGHQATLVTLGDLHQPGVLLDKNGRLPRLKKARLADSTAIVAGAALGTSSATAYIESAAGTTVGGRTGLTAVAVAAIAVVFILKFAFIG